MICYIRWQNDSVSQFLDREENEKKKRIEKFDAITKMAMTNESKVYS